MGNFSNITGFTGLLEKSNELSDGMIGIAFPLLVWIALFGYGIQYGRSKAIVYASFVTMIVLAIENYMSMVEYWVIVANGILLALGIFMLLLDKRRG